MTRTTFGASIILAAVVLTASACIIRNEVSADPPLNRPGYGPIPFTIPHESKGITLEQEISNVRNRQAELRAATIAYEQAYQDGTAAIIEERGRTGHAVMRHAQEQLLTALAGEHHTALERARTAQQHISAALAQAQDVMHAQRTVQLASVVEHKQQELLAVTRRADAAAGFLNDQTRRLRRAMMQ